MADIEKVDLESENLVDDRLNKLKELMPEVFTEGGIDFDKLRLELGDKVDEGQERYAFTWPGKADAIRQSQTVSTATLRPCVEKSRSRDGEDGSFDSDNIYIEGDNLEVLKLLQRGYHGKVNIVYIDPPYNTGHDFVYKDRFGDSVGNYKEQAGLVGQSNADTNGRFHSDWCSMMYPRLRLARELLADNGVLFMSIDEAEVSNLREIADEVMGPGNFIAQIIWSGGRKNDSKYISVSHEYVICYVKSIDYFKEHSIKWRKKKQGLDAIYAKADELKAAYGADYARMTAELRAWYKSLSDDDPAKAHKHYSSIDEKGVYFADNISWPGGGGPKYEVLHPLTHRPVAIPSRGWLFGTPERMQEIIDQDLVEFGPDETKVPCYKRYLKDTETEAPYSVIYKDGRAASKRLASLMGDKVFDNPKDEDVIAELLSYVDADDSMVMDFFSGSATTAHSVMMRNSQNGGKRKFILVQLPENLDSRLNSASKQSSKQVIENAIALCDSFGEEHSICTIAEERIRRAGDKIKTELEESNRQLKLGEESKRLPDIGFRVFELDDSGIERPEPGQLMLDVVKPDRTELDIVFEMMLRWGLELTLPVEKSDAAGYPIWSVACDELVCCMSRGLTIKALEVIADMEPRRVLILDSVLDDTLKLNAVQIFKHAGERMGYEIELRTV
ncbi:site-specific DNA-methyltransferase [Collinsella sp. HCP28S3_H5]|uniref:site-specific DNA-methyltransferase n=1 Tax=unclassified Collinsella TaxID=2637548 RepID=UPI003F8B8064